MVSESLRGIIKPAAHSSRRRPGPCARHGGAHEQPRCRKPHPRRQDLHAARRHPDRKKAGHEAHGRFPSRPLPLRPHHAARKLSTARKTNNTSAPSSEGADFMSAYINQFFDVLIQAGGSDLHLGEGQPSEDSPPRRGPSHSRRSSHPRARWPTCSAKSARPSAGRSSRRRAISTSPTRWTRRTVSAATTCKQTNGYGAVFRIIPTKIKTLEQLGVPEVIKTFGEMRGGMVLVTGPTGSGKIHDPGGAHRLHQHELLPSHRDDRGADRVRSQRTRKASSPSVMCPSTPSPSRPAYKAALREDADIVLVGEMRDLETIALALTARRDRTARLRHPSHEQLPQERSIV